MHLQHLLFPKGIVMLAFEPTHPLRKQGWRRGGGERGGVHFIGTDGALIVVGCHA